MCHSVFLMMSQRLFSLNNREIGYVNNRSNFAALGTPKLRSSYKISNTGVTRHFVCIDQHYGMLSLTTLFSHGNAIKDPDDATTYYPLGRCQVRSPAVHILAVISATEL